MPTYKDVVKTMWKVACMQKGLEKWKLQEQYVCLV